MKKKIFVFAFFISRLIFLFSEETQYYSESDFFYFSIPKEWTDVSEYMQETISGSPPNLMDFFYFLPDINLPFIIISTDVYKSVQNNNSNNENITRDMFSYENCRESEIKFALDGNCTSILEGVPSFYENIKIQERKVVSVNSHTALYFKVSFTFREKTYIHEIYNFLHKGIDIRFAFSYPENDYRSEFLDAVKSLEFLD